MKLSIASLGAEPGARYLEQVRLAEQLGFHAFFHNDKKWARELFSRLGAATQVTSRIGLGTSVVDPYTRHPAVMAQATATLAELAPGRFRVVMGSGSHFETLPGYGNPKPVAALRETTQLMRALWAGEKITIDGQIVKFRDGALDWKPQQRPSPLYRQPRPANPQARRRDRRRHPDRQLLDRAGHRICQAANPSRARRPPSAPGATSGCAPGSTSRCSTARTSLSPTA